MPAKFGDVTVSKVEVAKVQLDAAIAAYFEGRGIVAITLAGAAEEVFGSMLRRDCIQNSVEKIASLSPLIARYGERNERIDFLNEVKNNLKHASDSSEDTFSIAEFDPFVMIVRALANSELLNIEDTLAMKAFRCLYKSNA
jgi:hypothetical protein